MTGRLLGVPVRIAPVWAGVVVVVTVLYPGVVARLVPGTGRLGAFLMAFGLAVLLLISLLVHEIGHLVGCRIAGVPVRGVTLSLPGGRVEHDDPGRPRQAAIIAVCGPSASLVLAALGAGLASLSAGGAPAALFGVTALINLAVAAFTLLPGLPMDGGELVLAGAWAWSGSRATGGRVAGAAGRVLAIVIALSPLPLARTDDLAGSAILLAAGGVVAAHVWRGAGSAATAFVGTQRIPAWLVAGGVSVAAVLLVRALVVESLVVTSESMRPGLRTGDHIVVDKLSQVLGGVQRGDVVVLRRPPGADAAEDVLVKRVIGVGGDRISAHDRRVFRNDVALDEPYLSPGCADPAAGLASVAVPDRQVYVLGDNRCDSLDSRSFGPIDRALVEGRAVAVVWPLDRVGAIPGS